LLISDNNEKVLGQTLALRAGWQFSPRRRPPFRGHRTAKI